MGFSKILVPVGGTGADKEAINLACSLAKKDKSTVCAVYIIPIQRTLPLDAEVEPEISKGEAVLNHIEDFAIEQGCGIEADLLQAREVAPAIVDEAEERGADLILMGTEYRERFGEFSLGDIVPYVLKNARCRVIIYQQSIT